MATKDKKAQFEILLSRIEEKLSRLESDMAQLNLLESDLDQKKKEEAKALERTKQLKEEALYEQMSI